MAGEREGPDDGERSEACCRREEREDA